MPQFELRLNHEPLQPPVPRVGFKFIFDMWLGGVTLVRALSDRDIEHFLKYLIGADAIYEFGGESSHYKKLVPSDQKYIISGLSQRCDINLDMTNMSLADSSIDANFSAFALEHVSDYRRFISESFRTLRPGGRILLVVPFIYCFHGAPDDYVRFSKSYIKDLFSGWNIIKTTEVGNRAAIIAEMFNEKPWMGFDNNKFRKFVLRIISTIATIIYMAKPYRCKSFPSVILILAEKPTE